MKVLVGLIRIDIPVYPAAKEDALAVIIIPVPEAVGACTLIAVPVVKAVLKEIPVLVLTFAIVRAAVFARLLVVIFVCPEISNARLLVLAVAGLLIYKAVPVLLVLDSEILTNLKEVALLVLDETLKPTPEALFIPLALNASPVPDVSELEFICIVVPVVAVSSISSPIPALLAPEKLNLISPLVTALV